MDEFTLRGVEEGSLLHIEALLSCGGHLHKSRDVIGLFDPEDEDLQPDWYDFDELGDRGYGYDIDDNGYGYDDYGYYDPDYDWTIGDRDFDGWYGDSDGIF